MLQITYKLEPKMKKLQPIKIDIAQWKLHVQIAQLTLTGFSINEIFNMKTSCWNRIKIPLPNLNAIPMSKCNNFSGRIPFHMSTLIQHHLQTIEIWHILALLQTNMGPRCSRAIFLVFSHLNFFIYLWHKWSLEHVTFKVVTQIIKTQFLEFLRVQIFC